MQTCEIISIGFSVQFVTEEREEILWAICNVMSIRKPMACRHNLVSYTNTYRVLFDGRNMSNIKYSNQTYPSWMLNANNKKLQMWKKWGAKRNEMELSRIRVNWNQGPKRASIKKLKRKIYMPKKETHRLSSVWFRVFVCCYFLWFILRLKKEQYFIHSFVFSVSTGQTNTTCWFRNLSRVAYIIKWTHTMHICTAQHSTFHVKMYPGIWLAWFGKNVYELRTVWVCVWWLRSEKAHTYEPTHITRSKRKRCESTQTDRISTEVCSKWNVLWIVE